MVAGSTATAAGSADTTAAQDADQTPTSQVLVQLLQLTLLHQVHSYPRVRQQRQQQHLLAAAAAAVAAGLRD